MGVRLLAALLLIVVANVPAGAGTAQQPMRIGDGVKAPAIIHRVEPRVEGCLRNGRYGTADMVVVEMVIETDGKARDIRFVRGEAKSCYGKAFAEALKQWRFKPGTYRGKPVPVIFFLSYRVHIR